MASSGRQTILCTLLIMASVRLTAEQTICRNLFFAQVVQMCKLHCDINCKQGLCDSEGRCTCNTGFKKDLFDVYKCDEITCPAAVREDEGFCKSQCDKMCANGRCDPQGHCSCYDGYKKSPNGLYKCDKITCPSSANEDNAYCNRVCTPQCLHGTCSVSGACSCQEGFQKSSRDLYTCERITCPSAAPVAMEYCVALCTQSCENGKCNDYGSCVCNEGFVASNDRGHQKSQSIFSAGNPFLWLFLVAVVAGVVAMAIGYCVGKRNSAKATRAMELDALMERANGTGMKDAGAGAAAGKRSPRSIDPNTRHVVAAFNEKNAEYSETLPELGGRTIQGHQLDLCPESQYEEILGQQGPSGAGATLPYDEPYQNLRPLCAGATQQRGAQRAAVAQLHAASTSPASAPLDDELDEDGYLVSQALNASYRKN